MIKLKTFAAAAITAIAFTTTPVFAEGVVADVATQNGVLTGSVVDAAGRPQADVTVDIVRNGRVVGQATTAADGTYRVAGLTSGTYGLSAEGQTKAVRVWNGIAPAGAIQGVAIVSADETVNGNHGAYCPPAPCQDECQTGTSYDAGVAYAPQATYSQAYTTCQPTYTQKSCGSSGFLSNGVSNVAAVTGLVLGITGTAIAVDARDEAEHASRANRELAEEVQRRGEIMDAREETIEDFQRRLEQIENDLGNNNGGHVTP